ncbi:hypothetical protein WR25_09186 isoform D [Diploscapter pachys]|nr:hypothetical protein WR25_09186 isoform B [Diploscapter pachys]PAV91202.1 hypothetical protein WR25_09186 isoform C [Diploscapter pachys]PAV91203.1 hypothetical protein WR25_09186 isoform D [Diploscapter pachys]
MDIWAHTEDIRKDKYAINKFQSIYDRLTAFYDERHMLPRDVVFEIHCRDYINRHAISDREYLKEIGKGLYLDMCAYDHSCRPNTVYTCKGFIATLRGLNPNVNLSDRSTTFYAYIELTCSLQQRKKLLKDTWYFDCQCERCTDKTDNLLTSVICPYCPKEDKVAVCIFGDSTYKNKEAKTVLCHKCNTIIPQDYIMEALTTMNFIDRIFDDREVEQMPRKTQLEFLEDLLARAGQTLPDVNVYLCKIIQNLIGIVKPSDNETLLKLHQKAEQCVRKCFPHNHPAVAFHLRNIGIFLQNIGQTEKAVKYLLEAQEILEFTLDKEHCMTMKNQALLNDALAELRQKRQNVKNGTENTENVAEQVVPEEEKPVPDQSSLENVVEISNELINAIEEKSLKKIEEVLEVPKVPKQENGSSDKNQSKKQKKQQKQQQNQANGNSKNEKSPAVESESGKVTDLTQISQPAKTEQLTQNGTEKETRRETKKVVVCDDLYSDNMDDLPELVQ